MADTNPKEQILLAALAERYEVLRTIRERVQTVGLTAIGLLLAASGWIIQSDDVFGCFEKTALIAALAATVATLRFAFLADLERGFRAQQRVAARIERALGFYEIGAFDREGESLFPESWSKAGNADGDGKFFRSTHLMIYLGSAFLCASILLFA